MQGNKGGPSRLYDIQAAANRRAVRKGIQNAPFVAKIYTQFNGLVKQTVMRAPKQTATRGITRMIMGIPVTALPNVPESMGAPTVQTISPMFSETYKEHLRALDGSQRAPPPDDRTIRSRNNRSERSAATSAARSTRQRERIANSRRMEIGDINWRERQRTKPAERASYDQLIGGTAQVEAPPPIMVAGTPIASVPTGWNIGAQAYGTGADLLEAMAYASPTLFVGPEGAPAFASLVAGQMAAKGVHNLTGSDSAAQAVGVRTSDAAYDAFNTPVRNAARGGSSRKFKLSDDVFEVD
jgi:hypothetical protein